MTDDEYRFDGDEQDEGPDPYYNGLVKGFIYCILLELAVVGGWFIVTQVVL